MERGVNNCIWDKLGNEWTKEPSRTLGEAFEKEVADKMGITQTALSQIEAPNSKVSKATLEKLSKELGITIGQLR